MEADEIDREVPVGGVSSDFEGQNRENELTDTAPPNAAAFDLSYGLASPLKDISTFNYDDPLLYQNLHIVEDSVQPNAAPFAFQSARTPEIGSGVKSPNVNSAQWSLPGTFRSQDAMEVDSSPSFDPNSYYNLGPDMAELTNEVTNEITNFSSGNAYDRFQYGAANPASGPVNLEVAVSNEHLDMLNRQDPNTAGLYIAEDLSPGQIQEHTQEQHPHQTQNYLHDQSQNHTHDRKPSYMSTRTSASAPFFRSPSDFSSYAMNNHSHRTSQADSDMFHAETGHMLGFDIADAKDASHRASILAALNDLLPLTTTASFTPSATSLHLTQPSYFSAHQFMRTLMEQPPSLLSRASMDFYLRRRPSIESINSGSNAPVRPQRSLASYFHFKDRYRERDRDRDIDRDRDRDRGRNLPMLPSLSPVSAEWTHPRHSIRSIFKTSSAAVPAAENEPVPMEQEQETVAPSSIGPSSEDGQFVDVDGSLPKKIKRSKRNLFTRFKPGKAQDPVDLKVESGQEGGLKETAKHESISDMEMVEPPLEKVPQMVKATSGSLHNIDSAGLVSGDTTTQEPDYGALFTGVGKRRNLVSIKSKKKTDTSLRSEPGIGIKAESENEAFEKFERVETVEKVDRNTFNASLSSNDNLADCALQGSVPHSLNSFTSKESSTQNEPSLSAPLAFASASKRILGSRLMRKKSSNVSKSGPAPSDVVEVDLQSLDLPENTEILSNPLHLSKTRGRKEDKAADMVDQSKIFVCGYCDRRFKRQEHLKRHFRSLHTMQKPYDCPICLKKFSRTDNLAQHLKVHNQEEEEQAVALGAEREREGEVKT